MATLLSAGAPHEPPGQLVGALVVLDGLDAGDERADVADGALHEPAGAAGQVVHLLGADQAHAVEVDEVDVGPPRRTSQSISCAIAPATSPVISPPTPAGTTSSTPVPAASIASRSAASSASEAKAPGTGFPRTSLYYYFEGKEDILAFLFSEVLDAVGQAIDQAVATEGSAAERLHAAMVAHLRVFEAFPAASRALQFDLGRAARTPLINERIEAAFRGPIGKLLEDGAADGSLRPVEHPRLVAVAILGAVTTVGVNAVSGPTTRPIDEIADDLVGFVLKGVSA